MQGPQCSRFRAGLRVEDSHGVTSLPFLHRCAQPNGVMVGRATVGAGALLRLGDLAGARACVWPPKPEAAPWCGQGAQREPPSSITCATRSCVWVSRLCQSFAAISQLQRSSFRSRDSLSSRSAPSPRHQVAAAAAASTIDRTKTSPCSRSKEEAPAPQARSSSSQVSLPLNAYPGALLLSPRVAPRRSSLRRVAAVARLPRWRRPSYCAWSSCRRCCCLWRGHGCLSLQWRQVRGRPVAGDSHHTGVRPFPL